MTWGLFLYNRCASINTEPKQRFQQGAFLDEPPRKLRHRYHGVLTPNTPLRQAVTANAGLLPMGDEAFLANQMPVVAEDRPEAGSKTPSATAYLWAVLIARIYGVIQLVCPQCDSELKIVEFLAEADHVLAPYPYRRTGHIAPIRACPWTSGLAGSGFRSNLSQ